MTHSDRITRSAELVSLNAFHDFIDQFCASIRLDETSSYAIKLAVDEAATNVIKHSYAGMNPGSIIVEMQAVPDRVVIHITDFGHPFEPGEPEAPDVQAMLEDRDSAGFGLFFIYKSMDQVSYATSADGNTLTLIKMLPTPP
jgi:serine/threonine-protein kinase RsbW